MKYALILLLLVAVAGIIYWRLRPYLKMARRVLGVVRDVRRVSTGAGGPGVASRGRSDMKMASTDKLVRCAACGTWLPASRAVTLRASNASYCSHACLERAADSRPPVRKSAS